MAIRPDIRYHVDSSWPLCLPERGFVPSPSPQQLLNHRYRLDVCIGRGGMGEVWRALDEARNGAPVAIKWMPDGIDEGDRRRFEREVRVLQEISHPAVVPLLDIGWQEDRLFYVMEYVGPLSLEDVFQAHPDGLPPRRWKWFLERCTELLEALFHLHRKRLVHRDVKPSNILLRIPDEKANDPTDWDHVSRGTALLADLGLVARTDVDSALTQSALGTPQYMAPEQIENPSSVDERSDLWSVGILLYRGFAGRLPYHRLSDALSRRAPEPLPELPTAIATAISSLMEFEPHRRPIDAQHAAAMLTAAIADGPEDTPAIPEARRSLPSFIGRQAERDSLMTGAHQAARGEGRWIHIEGERGHGKTWLVSRSEFRSRALVEEQLQYFSGVFDGREPHSGFRLLLEQVLGHLDRKSGTQHAVDALGRWGGHLAGALPRLCGNGWIEGHGAVDSSPPPEIIQERVLESVVEALTTNAEVEPRTLVLEDLHYCDEFDIELLRRLVLASVDLPLLIVTTGRPIASQRLNSLSRLQNEIELEDRFLQIPVTPFNLEESGELLRSMLVPDLPISSSLAEALHRQSDGVPLILVQLLGSLWSQEALKPRAGEWSSGAKVLQDLPVPDSARSHFLQLLEELSAPQRRVLDVASIISGLIDFDLLVDACGIDEFELDTHARVLIRSGTLQEDGGGFRWGHGWEQEMVRNELTQPMQRRLNLRIGKLLEDRSQEGDVPVQAIAEHFSLGGDEQKGRDWLLRAADHAETAWAHDRALELCERALHLARDDGSRRELLARIGDLRLRTGDPEGGRQAFTQAMGLWTRIESQLLEGGDETVDSDLDSYIQLIHRIGESQMHAGEYDDALANFRKAQSLSEVARLPERIAMSLCRQGAVFAFADKMEDARVSYQSAVEMCHSDPELDNPHVVALIGLSSMNRRNGKLDNALKLCDDALALAERANNPMQLAGLLGQRGTLFQNLGRNEDAIDAYEKSRTLREESGDRRGLAITLMNLGRLQVSSGAVERGQELLESALQLFRETGDLQGRVLTLGNLGSLRFHRGDHASARQVLQEYLELASRHGLKRAEADARVSLGMLELERYQPEKATDYLEKGIEGFLASGDRQGALHAQVQQARATGRHGDHENALEQARTTAEAAAASKGVPLLIESLRIQAEALRELNRLDEALERVEESIEMCTDQLFPYIEGCCQRTLGKIQRDRGFEWADRAGIAFENALRIFEQHGARHALAVTRREFAAFLRDVDEPELAIEHLGQALITFSDLDCPEEKTMTEEIRDSIAG